MGALVYLDTETTGLDPFRHEVWEIAWAVEDGPVNVMQVRHSLANAEPAALKINGYLDRWDKPAGDLAEADLRKVLTGATLVCSNPSFDESFLRQRWGSSPWHHRKIDIATYAMPALGADRPVGLAEIAKRLGLREPDHTAKTDVLVLRAAYKRLTEWYAQRAFLLDPEVHG